jgi:hypothetical protein
VDPARLLLGIAIGSVAYAGARYLMLGDARSQFAQNALDVEGLGGAPETRDDYLALIAPGESEAMRRDMLQMNGCALVVRGLWRQMGINHNLLNRPYRIGMAVADVVQIAKDSGAWRTSGEPLVGDVFLIDNLEHVGTVVERPNGSAVISVDGGQRDNFGNQLIRKRSRVLVDGVMFGNDGVNDGVARRLIGYCDCVALAQAWGTT